MDNDRMPAPRNFDALNKSFYVVVDEHLIDRADTLTEGQEKLYSFLQTHPNRVAYLCEVLPREKAANGRIHSL